MFVYVPTYAGKDPEAKEEFDRLAQLLNDGMILLLTLHAAPAKPRQGMLVIADGTDWDPLTVGVPTMVWYNGTDWVAP